MFQFIKNKKRNSIKVMVGTFWAKSREWSIAKAVIFEIKDEL